MASLITDRAKTWSLFQRATLSAVALAGVQAFSFSAHASDPFMLAVIGDQQVPVNNTTFYPSFTAQTDWLAANAQANNLRFVTQVGDIIEHGNNLAQWDLAAAAMATLDTATNADGGTGIDWNVAYGNHEVNWSAPGSDVAGAKADNYRAYFGSSGGTTAHRYAGQAGFGGVSSNDLNTYHTIKSSDAPGAREYLMLNLEYDVPGHAAGSTPAPGDIPAFDAIDWAQGVIDAHAGMPTIITTHVFEGSKFGPPGNPFTDGPGRNSQLEIFDKLVDDNSQVFMVLSGHTSQDTHQVKTNAAGLPVLQMVTDYNKVLPNGGNGFMRLVELDETAGELRVQTYSPGVPQDPGEKYITTSNGEFTIDIDWATRFDGTTPPPPPPPVPSSGNLVGHWTFDEGTGTTAADSSGNDYDADQTIAAGSWVAGKSGGAYTSPRFSLDATESDELNLAGSDAVTLSVWVTDRTGTNFEGIAGFEGTGSDGDIYSLKVGSDDKISWTSTGSGPLVSADTLEDYADDNPDGWVHIVGVFDDGTTTLYVNGVEVATGSTNSSIPDKTTPGTFNIGRYFNSSSFAFTGAIDDVQVYDYALLGSQIEFLYANPGEAVIPEPSSLALLVLGGLCALRRRRA